MTSWFCRTPDYYTTKGGAVVCAGGNWFARAGNRVRGPMSSLDAAMDAVAEMLRRQVEPHD